MSRTLLFLVVVVSFTACGSRQVKTEHKGQHITITPAILETGGTDTVRFGRMRSGEIAQLKLWLANETRQPVVISGYERNCGCTTLQYDKEPVKPGEAQQLTLTFDTRGEWGWQLKTLDVSLAGASKPVRIFVEAEVQ